MQSLPQNEFDDTDQDLRSNDIFSENLQNEINSKEMINGFNYFFYMHGRFLGNLHLITVPQGDIPSFLKTEDVTSPNRLHQNFNRNDCRGLVSIQFFAAPNIYLGGNIKLSENSMTKLFSNISMQALSKSDDTILLDFTQIENLTYLTKSYKVFF